MKTHSMILYLLLCVLCCRYANGVNVSQEMEDRDIINIGVIVDMNSLLGKVMESCIKMAIKDFYNDNSQYTTRISLQIRDSMGDSLRSIAAALDLLETVKVHALIVPRVSSEELFMASLADKANVPLLSFSAISSFDEHPYYLQVAGDGTNEFHGIAALSQSFKWKGCVILYEDTFDARQVQPTLHNILLENNIDVFYQAPVSLRATDDQIVKELRIVMKKKASIIIVHLSPSLASQVFVNAKKLGLMSEGFAWIVTSKTMNLLSLQDSSAHELMQGVLGFKSHFSASKKFQNVTLRWRREFHITESNTETRDLNVYGLWAYDTVWALAHAIKRAGIKPYQNHVQCKLLDSACLRVSDSGQALLTQITFELKNRKIIDKTYEILNVIGNGERRVGYWKSASGLAKEIYPPNNLSSNSSLETIIWPGISLTTPASELVQISRKSLRVGIPFGTRRPELVSWERNQQTNVISADGFCIDVFRAAFDWLQYNLSFEFIPFHTNYSGLVDQVRLQNCDVAVGDISILANRSQHVDFTCPYTELGVGMVAKLDTRDPWFFTKPLDRQLWIMSGCLFVVMGAVVWLIEHPINEEFEHVGTLLWFAASTLFFAQRERLRSNISRFVVGIWLFVVLILTTSYTANLSSILTVQRFKLTERDYIGSSNPLVQGHIVDNFNFDDHRVKPYQTAEEYNEALRKGSKNGGVGAIVDEMPYIKIFLGKYPNEYTIIRTSMTTNGFGFAFPKGSFLAPELSRAIAGLREEKKLLEMENKWFQPTMLVEESSQSPSEESQPSSINALSIHDFSRLFLLSGISEVVALLLLLVIHLRERLFDKYLRFRAFAAQGLRILLNRFFANNPIMEIGLVPIEGESP